MEPTPRTESVFVTTNGCNRRLLDASRLIEYFRLNGFRIAENAREADHIFLFASSLNRIRVEESMQLIEDLSRQKGELIVLGCLPAAAPTLFRKKFHGKALTIRDLNDIDTFFADIQVPFREVPERNDPLAKHELYKGIKLKMFFHRLHLYMSSPKMVADRIYALINKEKEESNDTCFIWVSRGCPNQCAFCSERKAVGDLISRPAAEIVAEYSKLLNLGKREFEFIGDDVGSWGIDSNSTLPYLLEQLSLADEGIKVKWVIKHLHPKFLIKYRDDLIKYTLNGKVTEIICSFQTGSNRLLGLMNRNHTIEEVIQTISDFRAANPNLKFATNVIAGFPTETEEEFDQTLEVLKLLNFDRVHLIKYFDAEGTDSYTLEPKVSNEVIDARIKRAKKYFKQHRLFYQSRD
jgi:tRNA A37 methylthiotransferase MiaB